VSLESRWETGPYGEVRWGVGGDRSSSEFAGQGMWVQLENESIRTPLVSSSPGHQLPFLEILVSTEWFVGHRFQPHSRMWTLCIDQPDFDPHFSR